MEGLNFFTALVLIIICSVIAYKFSRFILGYGWKNKAKDEVINSDKLINRFELLPKEEQKKVIEYIDYLEGKN
ncbi:MAG: hypothetical protein RBS48_10495 [Ignavibacteriaceae bacterium]|jgi:hypothetical protein|nr:hypothetical protein [Ignavibacteriaceae bacterium]